MTFATHVPHPPSQPVQLCTEDVQRKIGRRCWDLKMIQGSLVSQELSLQLTVKAQAEMATELNWSAGQLNGFFQCLSLGRYNDSEWCLPPNDGNKFGPLAADSYLMGFDKIKLIENQARKPWVYFKFTVRERAKLVLVLSCHPTKY